MGISVERFPRTYWKLDGLKFNRFEDADTEGSLLRVVESSTGWEGRPPTKSERGKRNLQQGSRPGAAHLDERTIGWTGWSVSYSDQLITQEMMRLRGLCPDAWMTYEMTRWEPSLGELVANVQIDDEFQIERRFRNNQHELLWSAQFIAPDPRQYDATWRTFSAPMSGGQTGGVSASGSGVSASNPGVNAGAWVPDSVITVQNRGTAEVGIILELVGPWTNATVIERETQKRLYVNDQFYADNTLYINTDIDQQYGIQGRMALRDLVTSRRNRLVTEGGWFSVPPGQSRSYLWRADTYDANARMNIRYRAGWR